MEQAQCQNPIVLGCLFVMIGLFASSVFSAESMTPERAEIHPWPNESLTSETTQAWVYSPDPENGFYRGTRFDLSSFIDGIQYKGHTFFAWHKPGKHNPFGNDNGCGPVEEFGLEDVPPGYEEAAPGELFMKIGVGLLERPDDKDYFFNKAYKVIDRGRWTIRRISSSEVEFRHELKMPDQSYAYTLTRRIMIAEGGRILRIERRLENSGTKKISTTHYAHNFLSFDGRPIGKGYEIETPFPLELIKPANLPKAGLLKGNKVEFVQEKLTGTFWTVFKGFKPTKDDHQFIVRDAISGMELRVTTDLFPNEFRIYANGRVLCPEMFSRIDIEPGDALEWSTEMIFGAIGHR